MIQEGIKRDGLWAKALANSEGDEKKTKALYIQYRVQAIKDEVEVSAIIEETERQKQKPSKKIPTNDPQYILCGKCKFEQWTGYKKCQRCGTPL